MLPKEFILWFKKYRFLIFSFIFFAPLALLFSSIFSLYSNVIFEYAPIGFYIAKNKNQYLVYCLISLSLISCYMLFLEQDKNNIINLKSYFFKSLLISISFCYFIYAIPTGDYLLKNENFQFDDALSIFHIPIMIVFLSAIYLPIFFIFFCLIYILYFKNTRKEVKLILLLIYSIVLGVSLALFSKHLLLISELSRKGFFFYYGILLIPFFDFSFLNTFIAIFFFLLFFSFTGYYMNFFVYTPALLCFWSLKNKSTILAFFLPIIFIPIATFIGIYYFKLNMFDFRYFHNRLFINGIYDPRIKDSLNHGICNTFAFLTIFLVYRFTIHLKYRKTLYAMKKYLDKFNADIK